MLNISYNISPKLKEYLFEIETLRRYILLSPVSSKIKLKLRWEATCNKTFAALSLTGVTLKKEEVIKILSQVASKKKSRIEEEVLRYKSALDYILQNWLGSSNPISSQTILDLYKIIGNGRLSAPKEELEYLFDYLQAKEESPIITAAIVNIEIAKMKPFTANNFPLSLLSSMLFLYKYGYDFRGFISYETQWREDYSYFKQNYDLAMKAPTLTLWLEFFANCILRQLEKISQKISKPYQILQDLPESFWELNERQKFILSILDKPDVTVTNRNIQKRYNVSQITASRDLAKLTNLGFLFSHGKGRSVYYTKI